MNAKKSTKHFPDGAYLRIGIVASEYHKEIMSRLLEGAEEALRHCKVKKENIEVIRVPGSYEIPFGCLKLIKRARFSALVALGCIVKGETEHDKILAAAVSKALMDLSLAHAMPIGFGIITANNLAQANARSKGDENRGAHAALAAVKMGLLNNEF